jgi:hypothetical protein
MSLNGRSGENDAHDFEIQFAIDADGGGSWCRGAGDFAEAGNFAKASPNRCPQ